MSALEIVRRLHAQWPSIAADDAGAKDWRRVIERLEPDHAERCATRLIDGWTQRAPRIGDWHDAARATLPPPVSAPAPVVPRDEAEVERVRALIRETAEKLSARKVKR